MTDTAMAVPGAFRFGDVFSKALSIFGRRFGPFFVLTVVAQIPAYLISYLPDTFDWFDIWRTVVEYLVNLAFSPIASGAVIYGVIQELRGRQFSVVDSIQIALRRFLPMLGVAVCTTILIGLVPILLIVLRLTVFIDLPPTFLPFLFIAPGLTGGLMVACALSVSVPACIAEHAGVFESMARSRFLTKGYRWQVFGLFLLRPVASFVLWMPLVMMVGFGGIFRWALAPLETVGGVAVFTATAAIWAIVSAFYGVVVGVFYCQLRVAKEGVGIDEIASVFD